MITHAVYLEITNDLSTRFFILSLKRFIARRGRVKRLMSDNGVNFTGPERELKEAVIGIDQTVLLTSYYNIVLSVNLTHLPVSGWVVFGKFSSNK